MKEFLKKYLSPEKGDEDSILYFAIFIIMGTSFNYLINTVLPLGTLQSQGYNETSIYIIGFIAMLNLIILMFSVLRINNFLIIPALGVIIAVMLGLTGWYFPVVFFGILLHIISVVVGIMSEKKVKK